MSALDIFKAAGFERTQQTDPAPEAQGTLVEDTGAVTKEQIQKALPAGLKVKVSDELVDKINAISLDPMIADEIRSNFVGFTHVLKDGRFKVEDYLQACAYVTYKMMGFNNQEAYSRTFPDRIAKMRSEGKDDKHISSFVAAYNKNKLVNIILEQVLIPATILNQDLFQQALTHQAHLMLNAKSEKVQCEAANSLINALKRPETSKLEVDVSVKDNSGISQLRDALVEVASNQMALIQGGASTREIAHAELFDKDGAPV